MKHFQGAFIVPNFPSSHSAVTMPFLLLNWIINDSGGKKGIVTLGGFAAEPPSALWIMNGDFNKWKRPHELYRFPNAMPDIGLKSHLQQLWVKPYGNILGNSPPINWTEYWSIASIPAARLGTPRWGPRSGAGASVTPRSYFKISEPLTRFIVHYFFFTVCPLQSHSTSPPTDSIFGSLPLQLTWVQFL